MALWMTNREKLRIFVENELFPAWGVTKFVLSYWLKVTQNITFVCCIFFLFKCSASLTVMIFNSGDLWMKSYLFIKLDIGETRWIIDR